MAGIKSIGILTSGGDAPGMNAAIRAVTRSAIYNGFTVKGIMRGFKGLVFNEIVEFKSQSVSNIIQLGGTILKTARSEEFKTVEGRKAAYDNMVAAGIDALVVIGGDGSLTGAGLFAEEYNVPIVGLPGTIDNDLGGTDSTIGYDTALNTIMESVDKLRDTASSHERLFFVEVMGHTAGYLALNSAIATGSEAAIIPEMETEVDQLAELINHGFRKSKNSAIVIVAENPKTGQLSGGQQQRVSLARALVTNPQLLLMDEPLSNLDAKLRLKMREEIRNLQQKLKMTVLFVTHDQQECFAISDKVLIMKDGHIEQYDTPQNIFHHPRTEYVARFIGYDNFISINSNERNDDHHILVKNTLLTTKESNSNAKILTIRPENILLDQDNHSENSFLGTITSREYLGQSFKYTITSDLGIFQVEEARAKMRSSGDTVTLTLPAKHLHPLSE